MEEVVVGVGIGVVVGVEVVVGVGIGVVVGVEVVVGVGVVVVVGVVVEVGVGVGVVVVVGVEVELKRKDSEMKQLVKVEEIEAEGAISLLGENVTLFCDTYIYTGKLVGVNETFLKLESASIVYETGPFGDPKWKDAQPLPRDLYVQLSHIESFCILK